MKSTPDNSTRIEAIRSASQHAWKQLTATPRAKTLPLPSTVTKIGSQAAQLYAIEHQKLATHYHGDTLSSLIALAHAYMTYQGFLVSSWVAEARRQGIPDTPSPIPPWSGWDEVAHVYGFGTKPPEGHINAAIGCLLLSRASESAHTSQDTNTLCDLLMAAQQYFEAGEFLTSRKQRLMAGLMDIAKLTTSSRNAVSKGIADAQRETGKMWADKRYKDDDIQIAKREVKKEWLPLEERHYNAWHETQTNRFAWPNGESKKFITRMKGKYPSLRDIDTALFREWFSDWRKELKKNTKNPG